MKQPMPDKLPESRQALADYLDEMLHQATTDQAIAPMVENQPRVLLPRELLQTATEAADGALTVVDEKGGIESETRSLPEVNTPIELDFPLQCLMFRVSHHLLSVPLIQLSSVVNWSDAITRLPETPEWLLGLVKHRDRNLRVVSSQRLLNIEIITTANPEHLLVLDEGDWAITCDHLEQVVNLEYEDVQWKTTGADQLVLGTIRESLATLLNPPGISRELNSRAAPPAN